MSYFDCECKDKLITLEDCDNQGIVKDIKRAGDVVGDSEQCDIVPNTEKGIFRVYCLLQRTIKTICDIFRRMKCVQNKLISMCKTLHCMKVMIREINKLSAKRNRDKVRRVTGIEPSPYASEEENL